MDLPNNLALDATFRRVDRLPTNNAGVLTFLPDYAELDIRLGWRPMESLEIAVVGQNLLHESHPEFGVPGPQRTEIERGFFGRVIWRP
jgi:iron complex outermembrane receptor protein